MNTMNQVATGSQLDTGLQTILFSDHSGAELGEFSFPLDASLTVAEMGKVVVGESGLPRSNWDGSPKRYEAYCRGEKLQPDLRARDCGIEDGEEVEIFPSVVTASRS
jgi:hypothetical protein